MTKLHLAITTMIAALLVATPASAQRGGSSTASTYTGGGNTALPSLDQDNPKLHFDQGVAALQTKDYDRAVSEFREVIGLRALWEASAQGLAILAEHPPAAIGSSVSLHAPAQQGGA